MHTLACDDSLEYWPQDAPSDVDVSALPAAGAVTRPLRIPGDWPWLGFWGPSFSGLRIGFSPTKSFPVINGLAVPYPSPRGGNLDGLDVFLSRDTGGTGIVSIARFKTEAAARAWGGLPTPSTASGPGASSLPNRASATRTAMVAGVGTHVWTQAGFLYATILNPVGNGVIQVLGSFPLQPGAAENFFVGTATGFGFTGTGTEVIECLEYGRV
jgi:hypothetical protein